MARRIADGEQFIPIGRVARREIPALHAPAPAHAGGGIGDGIAAEAAIEFVERAQASLGSRIVGTIEQAALHMIGFHQVEQHHAGFLVTESRGAIWRRAHAVRRR